MYLCICSSSEYEEDFEADDDGPLDSAVKEKKSQSSFSENQGQVKEGDAFETEDEEKDGRCSLSFEFVFPVLQENKVLETLIFSFNNRF